MGNNPKTFFSCLKTSEIKLTELKQHQTYSIKSNCYFNTKFKITFKKIIYHTKTMLNILFICFVSLKYIKKNLKYCKK